MRPATVTPSATLELITRGHPPSKGVWSFSRPSTEREHGFQRWSQPLVRGRPVRGLPPLSRPYYKEAHSADGRSYIEKKSEGKWDVWFKGTLIMTRETRAIARAHIRLLKKASPHDNKGFISGRAQT